MNDRKDVPSTPVASANHVGEVRRWLWEQFNIREGRRPRPPRLAIVLWAGNPVEAAHSLRRSLEEIVLCERCDPRDARAWGKAASLEGRRTPKREVAAERRISERGLDERLRHIDAHIAALINEGGIPDSPPPAGNEVIVQGLVESATARIRGDHDEADGLYLTRADLGRIPPGLRPRSASRDRTRRSRARRRAHATLPLRAGILPLPLSEGMPPRIRASFCLAINWRMTPTSRSLSSIMHG
jgi:hypothetical protein